MILYCISHESPQQNESFNHRIIIVRYTEVRLWSNKVICLWALIFNTNIVIVGPIHEQYAHVMLVSAYILMKCA